MMAAKIIYKKKIVQVCTDILKERIKTATIAMEAAQAAANSEEKSSAGDKYETSRAMSHIEKDMHAGQLAAARKELAQLMDIDFNQATDIVDRGSLVDCKHVLFLIAAGLGKIVFEGKEILVISPAAPMARLLSGKKAGDIILFNKQEVTIIMVS